jgi:hypothetical protein
VRTTTLFELSESCTLVVRMGLVLAVLILLSIFLSPVGGLILIVGWAGFAGWRSYYRTRIREKLEIEVRRGEGW